MSENLDSILTNGEIEIQGRLVDASNATLFITLNYGDASLPAIYKPISGERPLWDFESGNLASRERAAYLVSELGDFGLVPLTILRDGPFGFGAVQRWIDVNEDIDLAEYFRTDVAELRSTALFDAIINNTDRKIGHLLPDLHGRLYVCDHGVTFHHEDKLRTVLWQWAGKLLAHEEINQLTGLREKILANTELVELINREEVLALIERIDRLISNGTFPLPNPEWPAVPWPPF